MTNFIRILFIPGIVLLAACGSADQNTASDAGTEVHAAGPAVINDMTGVTAYYECPMKCDGKQYDGPGKCPVCHMDLEKIEVTGSATDAESEEAHDHEHAHEHNGDGSQDHSH